MMYDSAVFLCTPCDDAEGMTSGDGPEGLPVSDEKKVFIFDHRGGLQLAEVERQKRTCFAPEVLSNNYFIIKYTHNPKNCELFLLLATLS